jgi:heme exporter protein D
VTLEQFLDMGGYARYVWPSYGLALLVLGWNLFAAVRRSAEVTVQTRSYIARGAER